MSCVQAVVGLGASLGKNRLNSTSPELGDGGGELGQAGRFLQLLGVLAVRELGCGGAVWIGKDSWVCQEAPPDTPPETLPLPHPPPHGPGWGPHPEQEARQGLGETGGMVGPKTAMLFPSLCLSFRKPSMKRIPSLGDGGMAD